MNSLVSYVRSLYHTIKKEDVLKTVEIIFTTLDENLLPMLNTAIDNSELEEISNNHYLIYIGKYSRIPNLKTSKDVLIKLKELYTSLSENRDKITNLITEELSDVISDTSTYPKDIIILKMVDSIGAFVLYLPDLLNYVVANKNLNVPKLKIEQITKGIIDYVELIKYFYFDFEKQLKEISKIKDEENYDFLSSSDGFISGIFNKILSKLGSVSYMSSFIGNPIYHIRMWLIDKEIEKYNKLKEQKEMFANQVLELKAKNVNDPKIAKAIEYYNKKIEDIEYQIKKIEES